MEKFLTIKHIGRPIAIIKGGRLNDKIVSIEHKKTDETQEKRGNSTDKTDDTGKLKDFYYHIEAYGGGKIPINKQKEEFIDKHQEITDTAALFEYIPNQFKREVVYIAGPSGSGKSYFSSRYIKKYKALFPNNMVFLFSSKPEDEQLDKLGVNRININEYFIESEPEYTLFKNSLCVFDDVDSYEGTKYAKPVFNLRDTLLKNGRAQNSYVISTIHEMFGYRTTRTSLSESQAVVFFPNTGADYAIKRWLKERVGLDRQQITDIFKINSRWILIYTHVPRFLLHEHGVKIL